MTTRVNLSGIDGNTGTLAESLTINAISHSTDISITSNSHVGLFVESANGNVGIGTTSPSTLLHLKQTSGNAILRINSDSGERRIDFGDSTDDDGGRIKYDASDNMLLFTNSSERLRIDSSGNVGIGGSPSYKLDVVGNARLNPTSNPVLRFAENGTLRGLLTSSSTIGLSVETSGALPFIVQTNGSERMRIDSSGNVGIGVSSMTNKLVLPNAAYFAMRDTGGAESLAIRANTSNAMEFLTGGGERMRIDSTGRLLVGATVHSVSSSQRFEVQGGVSLFQLNSSSAAPIIVKNTDQTAAPGSPQIIIQDGGGNRGAIYRDSSNRLGIHGQGGVTFHSGGTAPTTERMRINHVGLVTFNGDKNGVSDAQVNIVNDEAGGLYRCLNLYTGVTGNRIVQSFINGNGQVGQITVNGSATAYQTSSDYRLKENVEYNFDATTRLKQLRPARFNFITDAETTVDGFLAHEVSSIVPEAIYGEKNAMRDEEYEVTPAVLDEDGNVVTPAVMGTRSVPDYQAIDQSKLVPLLVKSLQEALADIDTLKAEVAALKNA